MACTYDISELGARLVGLAENVVAGDIVTLERGKNRALYRVMWIGKRGSPLEGQVGVRCVESEKMIWEVNFQELEEQYEAVLSGVGDAMRLSDGSLPKRTNMAGSATVVSDAHDQVAGTVTQLSYTTCVVHSPGRLPPQSSVQVLIISDEVDVRLRGKVERCDPPMLSIAIDEVRRGDRRKLKYLMETGQAKSAKK